MSLGKLSRNLSLTYLLVLLTAWSFGQSKEATRVLFVGNSYTYFWNLPQTVSGLAALTDEHIFARQSTAGGVNLKQHWNGDFDLKTRELIKDGDWDIVVLQNHSLSTIDSLEDFYEYGQRFIDLVKANDAIPVLYMTWAREFNPLMIEQISSAYQKLAADNEVAVVPVGLVWQKIRQLRPDLRLHDPDASHPSPTGTYVTACTFYACLLNKPATGLPIRVTSQDKDGEPLFLSVMAKVDAEFIHSVIDSINKK